MTVAIVVYKGLIPVVGRILTVDNHSAFGRSRVALKTFSTEKEAYNFFKYATSEIIRFAFLMTDESLTSLAKKVPDLLDYTDENSFIDYNEDINIQLYKLFGIDYIQQLCNHPKLAY